MNWQGLNYLADRKAEGRAVAIKVFFTGTVSYFTCDYLRHDQTHLVYQDLDGQSEIQISQIGKVELLKKVKLLK